MTAALNNGSWSGDKSAAVRHIKYYPRQQQLAADTLTWSPTGQINRNIDMGRCAGVVLELSLKLLSGTNDQIVINVIQVQVLGEIEAITELWLN